MTEIAKKLTLNIESVLSNYRTSVESFPATQVFAGVNPVTPTCNQFKSLPTRRIIGGSITVNPETGDASIELELAEPDFDVTCP